MYDPLCIYDFQNGLFDDIAEGLLSAKVVVICVSDEYADSSTCRIEFRYAANTLKLPIIMAVVGKGNRWRASEVLLLYSCLHQVCCAAFLEWGYI